MVNLLLHRRIIRVFIPIALIAWLLWQTAIIEILLIARFDGPRNLEAIALSFDDGPDWGEEELILELNRAGIQATFFWLWEKIELMQTEDIEKFARIIDAIKEGKHEIGIHGYRCATSWNPLERFFYLNEKENIDGLGRKYQVLFKKEPLLYRSHGARAGRQFYDSVRKSGLNLIIGSFSSQISSDTQAGAFAGYFQNAREGTIICAHDSSSCDTNYGLARKIARVIPEIGQVTRAKNMRVMTVSELLQVLPGLE